jgi:hypothetical protein
MVLPRQVATLVRAPSATVAGGVHWDAPSVAIFQPPDSTALKAKDQDVGVSGAKLP